MVLCLQMVEHTGLVTQRVKTGMAPLTIIPSDPLGKFVLSHLLSSRL